MLEEMRCLQLYFSCEKMSTNFAFTEIRKPKQGDDLETVEIIVLKIGWEH